MGGPKRAGHKTVSRPGPARAVVPLRAHVAAGTIDAGRTQILRLRLGLGLDTIDLFAHRRVTTKALLDEIGRGVDE